MITLSYPIAGGDFDSAGLATRKLKEQLTRLGVDPSALRRAMIAAYEAEMNVVIHARTGTLWARVDDEKLDLEVADEGPGIPNIELALVEGWSTASDKARQMGFGAGLGLPNIRRASDLFQIETRPGRGTRVRSTIRFAGAAADQAESAARSRTVDRPTVDPTPPTISEDRCRGCRRCVFACPVAALRVRGRKPVLRENLCLGCAECFAHCPDAVFSIGGPHTALPAIPCDAVLVVPQGLLTAFPGIRPPQRVLAALLRLGFTGVRFLEEWEEPLLSAGRAEAARGDTELPRIAPLCPPVLVLIESRFPSLIPHVSPYLSPAEAAAEEFPLRPVFLTAACPGQYGECIRSSLTDRLTVVSPSALKAAVQPFLTGDLPAHELALARPVPAPAGPAELPVSGAACVMQALSRAETGELDDIALLKLQLCPGGCSASPFLTSLPGPSAEVCPVDPSRAGPAGAVARARPLGQRHGLRLDPDMAEAMRKLSRIERELGCLPGRDCGSCGAPSCAAFAEDLALDLAGREDCPFIEKTERKE